jgi:MFS family permease
LGCGLAFLAIILQTVSQNIPMFVVARILIGLGVGIDITAISVYLGELVPYNYRDYMLGAFNDCWYIGMYLHELQDRICSNTFVGGLTSAGITYGTANMSSTWAWRLPSALQAIWSIITLATLMFLAESPRWLFYQDRFEEAFEVVALTHSDGDKNSSLAQAQFQEIVDTIKFEKESNQKLGFIQTMKTPNSRKRMELMFSVEIMTCFTGYVHT